MATHKQICFWCFALFGFENCQVFESQQRFEKKQLAAANASLSINLSSARRHQYHQKLLLLLLYCSSLLLLAPAPPVRSLAEVLWVPVRLAAHQTHTQETTHTQNIQSRCQHLQLLMYP